MKFCRSVQLTATNDAERKFLARMHNEIYEHKFDRPTHLDILRITEQQWIARVWAEFVKENLEQEYDSSIPAPESSATAKTRESGSEEKTTPR